ncbi:helix-turn-helix transcriptional regulator [Spirillospora sp. CA-294931]|uniref:helix-turn-helix transcriptional regulator n=1 Tax=Spirillospora sp. CA-294931 TaxID=3240042 RepID=UPI003D920AF1
MKESSQKAVGFAMAGGLDRASVDQMARDLCAQAHRGAGVAELGEVISRALAPLVAHDAARLVGANPAARLASFSFWHGLESDLGRAWLHNFFAGTNPLSVPDLLRGPVPAGVLGAGDRPRDRRAQRRLAAHGVGSELRLVLRDARGVWGTLGLLRAQGGRPFDDADLTRVASLAPALMAVLRAHVTSAALVPGVAAPPAGTLIVNDAHAIRATTRHARTWLQLIRAPLPDREWIVEPFLVYLAGKALRHAHEPRATRPLVVAPAASFGRWTAVQAEPLDDGSGDIAIIIQPAAGEQLLPAFCDWYQITPRESQILAHLRKAMAPKQIARHLDLSLHTINDHLKAIYAKAGVGGRDELLTALG